MTPPVQPTQQLTGGSLLRLWQHMNPGATGPAPSITDLRNSWNAAPGTGSYLNPNNVNISDLLGQGVDIRFEALEGNNRGYMAGAPATGGGNTPAPTWSGFSMDPSTWAPGGGKPSNYSSGNILRPRYDQPPAPPRPAPAVPPPPPAAPAGPALPPPPPRPQQLSWQNVNPSLLDIDALRAQFAANPEILAQFDAELANVQSQINAGAGEINRQRQFGVDQVNTLPGQYDRIWGGVQGLINSGTGGDAMAKYGQGAVDNSGPMAQALALTRGGFEANIPLLQAGFADQAARQQGWLTQLGSQMTGDVNNRKTGYLTNLDDAANSAAAQGLNQNNALTNQFAQFNSEGAANVARYNAEAQQAWAEGRYDDALSLYELGQQQNDQSLDLALQGVSPGMSLDEIAAMFRPQVDQAAETMDFDSLVAKYAPGSMEASTERGAKLRSEDYGVDDLHPNAVKTYQDVVDKLLGSPDPATWGDIISDKKYRKHPRALSLAMLAAGGPINAERLAGLA